jgi:AcrR family transcriptional regulator
MSPRKYDMSRRRAAVEATRQRIVAATVAAHRDLGIQATSWDEIARRAGVGVGTVYRHFPSYTQLLPACATVVMNLLALPSPDTIPALFDGAETVPQRARRLVDEVFDIYQRGAPFIENARRERHHLPALEHWHDAIEDTLDALTRAALPAVSADTFTAIRALTDVRTWSTLTDRGLTHTQAKATAAQLVAHAAQTDRGGGAVGG